MHRAPNPCSFCFTPLGVNVTRTRSTWVRPLDGWSRRGAELQTCRWQVEVKTAESRSHHLGRAPQPLRPPGRAWRQMRHGPDRAGQSRASGG